jgi:glycosyltransferase involved in cell wall biosynthesis
VTVVSEAMASLYRERYPDLAPSKIVVLENGVDSDDWRRADALRPRSVEDDAERDRGRFVLLHAGQLAHRPTARTLLEGARRAILAEPALASSLRIRFLGGNEELTEGDPLLASLRDVVSIDRSRPHLEALAAMRRADALALLGHGGAADSFLYTGKIYEYLTSGRPVLGILDDGPAARLLAQAGHYLAFGPDDADGVAAAIRRLVAGRGRGEPQAAAPPDSLRETWERRFQASKAAKMLDEITS